MLHQHNPDFRCIDARFSLGKEFESAVDKICADRPSKTSVLCSVHFAPECLFSRSAERTELLIEAEAHSAESLEARSAESRSDVAPNARRRMRISIRVYIYIYLFIYLFIYLDV